MLSTSADSNKDDSLGIRGFAVDHTIFHGLTEFHYVQADAGLSKHAPDQLHLDR